MTNLMYYISMKNLSSDLDLPLKNVRPEEKLGHNIRPNNLIFLLKDLRFICEILFEMCASLQQIKQKTNIAVVDS